MLSLIRTGWLLWVQCWYSRDDRSRLRQKVKYQQWLSRVSILSFLCYAARSIEPRYSSTQSKDLRQNLDFETSKIEICRNLDRSPREYQHWTHRSQPVRIRLSTFFYDNFCTANYCNDCSYEVKLERSRYTKHFYSDGRSFSFLRYLERGNNLELVLFAKNWWSVRRKKSWKNKHG